MFRYAKNLFVVMACGGLLWLTAGSTRSENVGQRAAAPEDRAQRSKAMSAQAATSTDALMDQWSRAFNEEDWVGAEKKRHKIATPADNSGLLKGEQGSGDTYAQFTKQDILVWERETEKMVVAGSRIFHDSELLGSQIAVSCDMCHPDAANTHPETYPKFQVQMGRVVLLRDMINWCIEQAVRGEVLEPDDPRMRALEAYILAQRKGKALDYGRH
jgi:thiosulfate dehydrogenase